MALRGNVSHTVLDDIRAAVGRIPCADAELAEAAHELVDYLNSPEKWPVFVEAAA